MQVDVVVGLVLESRLQEIGYRRGESSREQTRGDLHSRPMITRREKDVYCSYAAL